MDRAADTDRPTDGWTGLQAQTDQLTDGEGYRPTDGWTGLPRRTDGPTDGQGRHWQTD